jgi:hypothetical protein
LPTVWIDDELVVGMRPDGLRDAFTRAATGKPMSRLPTSLLWGVFTVGLAVVAALAMRALNQESAR